MGWDKSPYFNCSSPSHLGCSVPPSCCKHSTDILCGMQIRVKPDYEITSNIYSKGCINSLFKMFKDNLIVVGVLAFGVGLVEMFAIILANLLMRIVIMSRREQHETAH